VHCRTRTNESIGVIALPKALNFLKGSLQLGKVDVSTLQVVKVWPFPYGVRPFVIAPDGTTMYAQLSQADGDKQQGEEYEK
jgi:hypothetical protein